MSISTDKSQAGAVDTFHKGLTHTKACQTRGFCKQTHSTVTVFNKALCVRQTPPVEIHPHFTSGGTESLSKRRLLVFNSLCSIGITHVHLCFVCVCVHVFKRSFLVIIFFPQVIHPESLFYLSYYTLFQALIIAPLWDKMMKTDIIWFLFFRKKRKTKQMANGSATVSLHLPSGECK